MSIIIRSKSFDKDTNTINDRTFHLGSAVMVVGLPIGEIYLHLCLGYISSYMCTKNGYEFWLIWRNNLLSVLLDNDLMHT